MATTSAATQGHAAAAAQDHKYVPKELPYAFEKELIEKQNKRIHLVTELGHPASRVHPIAAKSRAQDEQRPPNYDVHLRRLQDEVGGRSRWTRDGYPRLQSQVYGWAQQLAAPQDLRELNFVTAPKQHCCMTAFGEQLIANRHTERPHFNGLRFLLQ